MEKLDFDELAEDLLRLIADKCNFLDLSIFLYSEQKKGLIPVKVMTNPIFEKMFSKMTKLVFSETIVPLSAKDNMIIKAYKENKIVQTHNYRSITDPVTSNKQSSILRALTKSKKFVAVPISTKGNVLGVYLFGLEENRKLTSEEEKFLFDISHSVAGYLYSIWQLEQGNSKMKERVENLEKLHEIKNNFFQDMYGLLENLDDQFLVDDETKQRIKDTMQYMKSLYLMDEIVNK